MSWGKDIHNFLWNDLPEIASSTAKTVGKVGEEIGKTAADVAVRTGSELASGAGQLVNRVGAAGLWAGDKALDLGENVVDMAVGTDFADRKDSGYENAQKFLDKNLDEIQQGNKELKGLSREHVGGDFSKSEGGNMAVDVAANIASFLVPMGQAGKAGKVIEAIQGSKAMGAISKVGAFLKNPVQSRAFAKEIAEAITANGGKINTAKIMEIGAKYSDKAREAGEMFIKTLSTPGKNKRLADLLAKMPKEEIATFASRHPKIAKLYGIATTGAKVTAPIAYGTSEAVSDMLPPSDDYDEADKLAVEENKNIPDEDKSKDTLSLDSTKPAEATTQATPDKKGIDEDKLAKENPNLNVKGSLVDTMKALNINSSMEARKAIYENMTGKPYHGSADENVALKGKLKDMSPEEIVSLMKKSVTL